MNFEKNRKILNFIIIFSFFALGFAYFVEYILGHEPCYLCKIERIPYIGSLILIFIIFIIKKKEKIILSIVTLLFISGTIISFYHFGIEQGFFNEANVCDTSNIQDNTSTKDLLKELEKTTISCKDVNFTILGLSLATINTIMSFLISVMLTRILLKK